MLQAILPPQNRRVGQLAMLSFQDGMEQFLKLIEADFGETVKTWNDKPVFEKTLRKNSREIVGKVSTKNKIYTYVSGGTRVRYATLSRDWKSKTRPGSISSGGGQGRVLFVNKKYPKPGIEARKFDKQIKDRRAKTFMNIMLDRAKRIAEEV